MNTLNYSINILLNNSSIAQILDLQKEYLRIPKTTILKILSIILENSNKHNDLIINEIKYSVYKILKSYCFIDIMNNNEFYKIEIDLFEFSNKLLIAFNAKTLEFEVLISDTAVLRCKENRDKINAIKSLFAKIKTKENFNSTIQQNKQLYNFDYYNENIVKVSYKENSDIAIIVIFERFNQRKFIDFIECVYI